MAAVISLMCLPIDCVPVQHNWASEGGAPRLLAIQLYVQPDSEPCQQAEQFLQQLQSERRGLDIAVYDVIQDPVALSRLWSISRNAGLAQAKLPTFHLCDRVIVGFDNNANSADQLRQLLNIDVYIRPGCRHCKAAESFLDQMVQRWPALKVQYFDAVNDAQVRRDLEAILRRHNQRLTLLPCIHVADRILVGYDSDATTGARIEAIFNFPQPTAQGASRSGTTAHVVMSRETSQIGPSWGGCSLSFGSVSAMGLTLPVGIVNWHSNIGLAIAANQAEPLPAADDAPPPPTSDSAENAPPPPFEATIPQNLPHSGPEAVLNDAQRAPPSVDVIEFELFGRVQRLSVSDFGLPAFTFLIGLIDGFNPCAMWVLVFLLSILVNIRDRKKIIVIAGLFVLVSGLAYFAFMAAWLNVFQLIGLQRPVQIALGCLALLIGSVNIKDFFAFHRGVTFSIPDAAKPGIYQRVRQIVTTEYLSVALTGAITLALFVNIVELLCTAGLPALYTEILTMHELPSWKNYAYLALYNVAYMLDDTILLAVVVTTLSHRRLQEREGRWLKLISGIVILALGLTMILVPDALTLGSV